MEFSRGPGNFQVLEIFRLPGKFQDPGYFQAPWKIPGGSLSPVRHAVITLTQQAQEEALTDSTNLQATKAELYKGGRARG